MVAKTADAPTVIIEDETLRDGLQLLAWRPSLEDKLRLFRLLFAAGLPRIQVGALVRADVMPQMADTEQLLAALSAEERRRATALAMNRRGLDRALTTGLEHISLSASLTEKHSLANTGRGVRDGLFRLEELIRIAAQAGLTTRAGLQNAFGGQGESVAERTALLAAERLLAAGAAEINLADTSAVAEPEAIHALVSQIARRFPTATISLHLHNQGGRGLAGLAQGFAAGARIVDCCLAGLGGCPFIQSHGAADPPDRRAGNLDTEKVAEFFTTQGIATGVSIPSLSEARRFVLSALASRLCSVPCDHIPIRSWPLFHAQAILREMIESHRRQKDES
ncbi:MAG: hypothetical protein LBU39_08335 [Desulfobulbaceae bacterium]|jgi:hydroxymethylglutaryl-CoA lyase|nr:hypothetical protein [Desulfobulbaceae bacterium]